MRSCLAPPLALLLAACRAPNPAYTAAAMETPDAFRDGDSGEDVGALRDGGTSEDVGALRDGGSGGDVGAGEPPDGDSATDSPIAAATKSFGKTTIGSLNTDFNLDRVWLSRYVLDETADAKELAFYGMGNDVGPQRFRGVIYADEAGEPGAFVAVGAEVT